LGGCAPKGKNLKIMKDLSSTDNRKETLGKPYYSQRPLGNFKVHVTVVILSCLLLGAILSVFVGANTDRYWKFIETATPADINQIQVQRIDINKVGIGPPIVLKDHESIANFVSVLKTAQSEPSMYRGVQDEFKVKVWLKDKQTIEFECQTKENYGKTIFVGNIWLEPSLYGFGSGNAVFPASGFHDWLLNIGMDFE
jgi:hypothetical protein